MPIIIVYGFPKTARESEMEALIHKLQNAAASVYELRLSPGQVSVFFPVDLVQSGLGEELIATVEGLLARPERTERVRQELAEEITEILTEFARNHLGQCNLVETLVNSSMKTASSISLQKKEKPEPPIAENPPKPNENKTQNDKQHPLSCECPHCVLPIYHSEYDR